MPNPRISLIIPTLREAANLPLLLPRIAAAMGERSYEVLVVDDNSPDSTPAVCAHLAKEYPLRLIVRPHPRNGLSGAVLEGMAASSGELLLVMDADLQHPPERIPALLEPLERGEADFTLGSRYVPGGSTEEQWGRSRGIGSRVATLLARPLIGGTRDPMSGFFAIKRGIYEKAAPLAPIGYKIGLELMCKGRPRNVREVPIHFRARREGKSKLNPRQQLHYLRHLGRLYGFTLAARGATMMRNPGRPLDAIAQRARPLLRVLDTTPRWLLIAGGMLILAMALRLVGMAGVPLIPEEAYYWMYGQHPALSYHDHPPLVAWIIQLGTLIFGDTELGVRIVGGSLMLGASGLMYSFGRMWFGRTAALLAALSLQVLPFYFGLGFIATMDSALVFFWLLGMVGVSHALQHDRPWGWGLAGLAVGAAMLSKYTGVFLGAGMVLAVLGHRPWRRHLKTIHPYLAAVLAMALFSPVVIWNARHGWASFRFQFIERFADDSLGLRTVGIFLLYQLLVATPLVLAGLALVLWRLLRRRRILTPRWWIAASFSLPLLAVMAYKSLFTEVHINWTAPLYLSVLPAVSWMFIVHARWLRRQARGFDWVPGIRATTMVCLGVNIGLMLFLLTIQPRLGLISAFGPWTELATLVENHEDQLDTETGEEAMIIADGKYRLASILAFYRMPIEQDMPASDQTSSQSIIGQNGLGFAHWTDREDWRGRTCLFIDERGGFLDTLTPWFDSVQLVNDPRLALGKGYRMAICRGYRATPQP